MSKSRHRTPPDPGEFRDPLSDYRPADHADELERSLMEDSVAAIASTPFQAVSPDTSVRAAMQRMVDDEVACLVVTRGDRPIGIFSERDVLNRLADRFEQFADGPIERVMTADPVVVHTTDTPARVLNVMGDGQFRHVPVVDVDGKLVGVIGARRVTAYLQRHTTDA